MKSKRNRDSDWLRDASCRGMDPEIFYPQIGTGNWPTENMARKTCDNCPVKVDCIDWALSESWPEEGYWGSTKGERNRFKLLWEEPVFDPSVFVNV